MPPALKIQLLISLSKKKSYRFRLFPVILILLVSSSYHVTPIWFKVGFLSDFSRQFVMVLYRGNQNDCLANRTIFHGLVTCRLGWLVGYVPHVIQLFSSTWPTLTDAAVCRYVYFLLGIFWWFSCCLVSSDQPGGHGGLGGLGDVLTVLACSPCSPNNNSITIILNS